MGRRHLKLGKCFFIVQNNVVVIMRGGDSLGSYFNNKNNNTNNTHDDDIMGDMGACSARLVTYPFTWTSIFLMYIGNHVCFTLVMGHVALWREGI